MRTTIWMVRCPTYACKLTCVREVSSLTSPPLHPLTLTPQQVHGPCRPLRPTSAHVDTTPSHTRWRHNPPSAGVVSRMPASSWSSWVPKTLHRSARATATRARHCGTMGRGRPRAWSRRSITSSQARAICASLAPTRARRSWSQGPAVWKSTGGRHLERCDSCAEPSVGGMASRESGVIAWRHRFRRRRARLAPSSRPILLWPLVTSPINRSFAVANYETNRETNKRETKEKLDGRSA